MPSFHTMTRHITPCHIGPQSTTSHQFFTRNLWHISPGIVVPEGLFGPWMLMHRVVHKKLTFFIWIRSVWNSGKWTDAERIVVDLQFALETNCLCPRWCSNCVKSKMFAFFACFKIHYFHIVSFPKVSPSKTVPSRNQIQTLMAVVMKGSNVSDLYSFFTKMFLPWPRDEELVSEQIFKESSKASGA